ncbi:MAG: FecR family protein [Rhodospirillales bacterium]|jgi:hypothetical protein|nr:hypothetical protein [Rhodospirillaceae bacterium]MDP6430234.1 FecR family protein [Rhodospirillales bacterium]MDP6646223.1 FecR family protein [Rhodospirillales bacterium]MDP6840141.1 FecR family protein [Rhodospirillales bacterium]|tara:strand:+ start:73 stop:723 length:651 start_codon:yes stop_codon:yes gene_type:complete
MGARIHMVFWRIFSLVLIVLFSTAMVSKPDVDDVRAGTVTRILSSAIAIQDARPRVLKVGSPIFINDIISTGPDSRLEIKMIDDTVLTLSSRTQFVVMRYQFDGKGGDALLRLISGTFRAVTGKLAKLEKRPFKVVTNVATIGVRGTDFWVGAFKKVPHVQLLGGGGVYVENGAGRVEIVRAGWGTFIKDANTAPTAPEFWPPQMNKMVNQSMSFK